MPAAADPAALVVQGKDGAFVIEPLRLDPRRFASRIAFDPIELQEDVAAGRVQVIVAAACPANRNSVSP